MHRENTKHNSKRVGLAEPLPTQITILTKIADSQKEKYGPFRFLETIPSAELLLFQNMDLDLGSFPPQVWMAQGRLGS